MEEIEDEETAPQSAMQPAQERYDEKIEDEETLPQPAMQPAQERYDEQSRFEATVVQMMEIFPSSSWSVLKSLCTFIARFHPTKAERILNKLEKEQETIIRTYKGNTLTNLDIENNEIDHDKETQVFFTSLILMLGSITCCVLYYILIDLTKNDNGAFDYNVNLLGGLIALIASVPLYIYCGWTEGWDFVTFPNFTNAFLGRVFVTFQNIMVILGLSFDISASLATVIVTFFAFPLLMIIKFINGNKDMTFSSSGNCLVIISISLLITVHFNMFEASPIGLIFFFIGAMCCAFHSFSTGIYFSQIEVGNVTTVFFAVFPTAILMCIFGTVQELIKRKSFQEIFSALPFGMLLPWVIFALVYPVWTLTATELCKISSFQKSIADFIAVFIISIVQTIKDFFKEGTPPDAVYLLGVLSLIICAITFMINMKSKLTKLKAMQVANGELTLLRIERIVNLEILGSLEAEFIVVYETEDGIELRIPLLEKAENEEGFCHQFHLVSEENVEALKEEILKKYADAKQRFIEEHDFALFGMKSDFEELEKPLVD